MAQRFAALNDVCATVDFMRRRAHSLSDHSALRRALIVLVCALMAVLSGSSLTLLAGAGSLSPQIDSTTEAPNQAAVPMVDLPICSAEAPLEDLVEPVELTDDDETKHSLLRSDVVAACLGQTGLCDSAADQAPIPFRLQAFPSRGSPSA